MYFVMLNQHDLNPTPLIEWKPKSERDSASVAYHKTFKEAEIAAQENMLGKTYGYEIFKIGKGEK